MSMKRLPGGAFAVTLDELVLIYPHAGARYHRHSWCVPTFHASEHVSLKVAARRLGMWPCLRCFPRGVSFTRARPR